MCEVGEFCKVFCFKIIPGFFLFSKAGNTGLCSKYINVDIEIFFPVFDLVEFMESIAPRVVYRRDVEKSNC